MCVYIRFLFNRLGMKSVDTHDWGMVSGIQNLDQANLVYTSLFLICILLSFLTGLMTLQANIEHVAAFVLFLSNYFCLFLRQRHSMSSDDFTYCAGIIWTVLFFYIQPWLHWMVKCNINHFKFWIVGFFMH